MKNLDTCELNDNNVDNFFEKINSLLEKKLHPQSGREISLVNETNKTVIQWEYNSLLIYMQNVRNLSNKNHDIKPKTFDTEYDIMALTETFFNDGNLDEEYFCDSFMVFRCDRNKSNSKKSMGGGTLLAIKKNDNYSIEQIDLKEFDDIEIVGAKIKLSNEKYIFFFLCLHTT